MYLNEHGIPSFEKTTGIVAWEEIKWYFQARHIYVHNAGVIDERFALKQPGFAHLKGRILPLEEEKLADCIDTISQLCQELHNWFQNKTES